MGEMAAETRTAAARTKAVIRKEDGRAVVMGGSSGLMTLMYRVPDE
jgi:hypothetical protein